MNTAQIHKPVPYRIGILIPYYGKLPWYFRFFAASCAYNPEIDFFLITDIDIKEELPPNVIVVKRTMKEIKITAEQKLQFEVCLEQPYKLCDFRPAYGLLFADIIDGYDFWGYGDIDIIYGKIRNFITGDILREYDTISTKPQYFTGFFALLKNTSKINNMFRESKDYKKVFQSSFNYCFDEMNWHWLDLMNGKSIFQIKSEIQSMSYVIKKLALNREIKSYYGSEWVKERTDGKLMWQRGSLTYDNREILLYHFYSFKSQFYLFIPSWKKMPETYYGYPFYFLKFSHGSIAGKLISFALKAFKTCHYYSARAVQYFQWLSKYLRSSARLKNKELSFGQELSGTYKSPPDNVELTIKMVDNTICGDWQNNTISLRHIKNDKFIVSKFSVGPNFDIDVRVYYDKSKASYAIAVRPHRINKMTLYKT